MFFDAAFMRDAMLPEARHAPSMPAESCHVMRRAMPIYAMLLTPQPPDGVLLMKRHALR
jgi:hypothetical protein